MKRFTLLFLCSFFSYFVNAQTDGISYQAVIIDNNPQEIPGVDIPANNLPNVPLDVQFSIMDNTNSIEYQETHNTSTDPFGMINLMIGQGIPSIGAFNEIYWDNAKHLSVEIDMKDGNGLVAFSYQELTYIPYVRHREIIATSTLDVDGATNLNNTLTVDEETNLNSELHVNNQATTFLSGDLYVEGTAYFSDGIFDNLTVNQHSSLNTVTADGVTNINNTFNVNNANASNLNGALNVDGVTTLNNNFNVLEAADSHLTGTLLVDQRSDLRGPVNINVVTPTSGQSNYNAYPLQVEGSQQGIAIKISPNNPNRNNNYLAFWDGDNIVRGRIEANNGYVTIATDLIWDLIGIPDFGDIIGEDPGDNVPDVTANQYFNNDYAFGAYSLTVELVNSIIRFGINATAASGLCVAGDCDDAIWSFIDIVVAGIQLGGYITYNEINIGVAYESGGADYAEWLKKLNTNEVLSFGDVVGVKGGLISKSFTNANTFMVISQNPMISAAMPEEGKEYQYDKVAFIGQVPVKVLGKCFVGDYILASGNGDGFAIAVAPKVMKIKDYKKIIGVAWADSGSNEIFNYVQTAIGINTNDLVNQVEQVQAVMNEMQKSLAKLDPEFQTSLFDVDAVSKKQIENTISTMQERVAEASNALEYNSLKEALQQVEMFSKTENTKFDVMKLPHLKNVLENPTSENLEILVAYYTKVLKRLELMIPSKQ